jgi:hypothetical protein
MSAAYLELAWDTQQDLSSFAVPLTVAPAHKHVREISTRRVPAICPECKSIIYSRRHPLCGVCNQPLPEHLLFTGSEAQRVTRLLETERLRHRRWLQQRGE